MSVNLEEIQAELARLGVRAGETQTGKTVRELAVDWKRSENWVRRLIQRCMAENLVTTARIPFQRIDGIVTQVTVYSFAVTPVEAPKEAAPSRRRK